MSIKCMKLSGPESGHQRPPHIYLCILLCVTGVGFCDQLSFAYLSDYILLLVFGFGFEYI